MHFCRFLTFNWCHRYTSVKMTVFTEITNNNNSNTILQSTNFSHAFNFRKFHEYKITKWWLCSGLWWTWASVLLDWDAVWLMCSGLWRTTVSILTDRDDVWWMFVGLWWTKVSVLSDWDAVWLLCLGLWRTRVSILSDWDQRHGAGRRWSVWSTWNCTERDAQLT